MFGRILSIATLALACSACLAQADEKIRIGTPEATSFSFSVPDVGNAVGIFKKYGLDVERIDFAGGAKMHQAMDAGALDAISGTGSDILFLTKGAPEKGVAAYANDLAALSLVINADNARIKKIEDLKGKTIAVSTTGSFTSWVAKTILGQHGVTPDQFTFAYLGTMNGIVAGLLTKNVDGIIGPSSRSLQLQGEGKVKILANAGKEITNFIANIVYASDTMMNEHPETLKKFLAGYFETIRYMKAHKAETVKFTQNATRLPDDIAAEGYDLEMPTFFDDGHFDRKKLAAVQQSLVDLNLIPKAVPDDTIITEKFLP
ncbi:MAG TPA: ABC transporter substrate-binding protein [Stellaceae bacterium]|jgi:NitT/TauT family transport system substrate-binding protein|nr:ABC transporter substrate-binding protein [Stellaceae bacterium]